MAKKSKGMVLYEVIRQNQARLSSTGKPQEVRPKKRDKKPDNPQSNEIAFGKPRPRMVDNWPPKATGLGNALLIRKLRISIGPAKLKAMMIVILLLLVAIIAVQLLTGEPEIVETTAAETAVEGPIDAEIVEEQTTIAEKNIEMVNQAQVLAPIGDHTIVIMTYSQKEDLAPAKEYFDKNGIETTIEKRGDYYFLLTANRFMSPKRAGTDGYKALRKIKQVGAEYKAPSNFETFGEKPFQDAYGMKIR